MSVYLQKASVQQAEIIRKMQTEAFAGLLEKYQDHDISPAAESLERVREKFEQPGSAYYFIMEEETVVGAVRVVDRSDGSRKRISPIWIMPAYRNRGYAQQAFARIEQLYGPDHWCLDTILQEEGNIHLYEKLGYRRTGKIDHIHENMDIVFFEKN